MASRRNNPVQVVSENLFPVIGVGASAGGLGAFRDLVKAIPESSGMAYILIQHLMPHHESLLPEILQTYTSLPVLRITDHVKVEPNRIYIIPPNRMLTANDGILLLNPLSGKEKLNLIDVFFISLAEIHGENAVGVVLSGTGTDGTIGLKMIKDQGGITIVQDHGTAAYHDMPQSAIDASVVDFILPPAEIPGRLQELVKDSRKVVSDFHVSEMFREEEVFRQILTLLRVKKGVDFTFYKQTTIRRRIIRRKVLNHFEKLKEYQEFLFDNKTEQDALFKDVLIPVTVFFRDPDVFEFLLKKVFPVLFKDKAVADPVRIWVAGCSTGEEAYSIAISLYEFFRQQAPMKKIQVFATDISEAVIAKARRGVYEKKDMAGVSEEQLKRFFTKTDGSYQVSKVIREMCVFATQNFLKDPPFARMDLISCRNVLIYMEPYLQKKAIATFHYALNPPGFLMLGNSETAGQSADLFQAFSPHEKIYSRKGVAGKFMPVTTDAGEAVMKRKDVRDKNPEARKDDHQKAADEALLVRYAPVGVVVNEQLNIVQFRGATGPYLQAPPGKATHHLLKMAREGLAFELRNALHKAKLGNGPVKAESIVIDPDKRRIDIEVIPLDQMIEPYYLILFSASSVQPQAARKKKKPDPAAETKLNQELIRIEELEKELTRLHHDMMALTEDQDATNEELQSTNEDLLASSEELQSLNEELETSKEEIQSSNEELIILNQELFERNEQLSDSRHYAESIVATIHEPLVILTSEFRVKSANKSFYDLFQTTEKETDGRKFFELGEERWNFPDLREQLKKILPEQAYFEGMEMMISIQGAGARVLTLNARQLINNKVTEPLILLAMQDITERKQVEQEQRLFAQELEKQVAERTRELEAINVHLRNSNENLRQFASIASHDLQEPLRKIKTFVNVLNKNYSLQLPADGKEVMEKISLSADRMSQLIREVLEYSKLTRSEWQYVQTDLDLILRNVINNLDLRISETGAVIHYPVPLPVIEAIPLQMNQLFYNLLTNSLKFRRSGLAPAITVSVSPLPAEESGKMRHAAQEGAFIEIRIADNGIGFEQGYAEQIFQLFERLHSSDEFEGTGVGLSLCKKVIENHHGRIFAIGEEDKGAVFHVILPVMQA